MAYVLPNSVMVHVPKTGGMACAHLLAAHGLVRGQIQRPGGINHPTARTVRAVVGPDRFVFAFVRHPLDWLRSFWCFQQQWGWEQPIPRFGPLDEPPGTLWACCDASFEGFVRRYLDRCPGEVGRMFDLFTGLGEPQPADFIGRQERLMDDLTEALRQSGDRFDPVSARTLNRVNVSKSRNAPCPESLRARVLDAESGTLRRYGYA